MHNLLLGLVMFHFRNVLGIDNSHNRRQTVESQPATVEEVEEARKVLGPNATAKTLGRLTVPVLKALCAENNVKVIPTNIRKGIRKVDLVTSLLLHGGQQSNSTSSVENIDQGGDDDFAALVGEEYVVECAAGSDTEKDHAYLRLSREELERLRGTLVLVTRPTWHCGPPLNLGEPGHGKLKADEWRSCIEFDLPVTLVELWSGPNAKTTDEAQTSTLHAQRYMDYMHAYLVGLRNLHMGIEFRSNHHFALHIGEFFVRFGPMHGWWMFPFERIIGILQQVNTNHKLGQLETTMLESFCAAANVKGFLQQAGCPSILKESAAILEQCWGQYNSGTLMTDIRTLAPEETGRKLKHREVPWQKRAQLSVEL
ncbi:hypothetical protein BV22DRAFT_986532, partial [Leucogyrophana mollusca]